MELRGFLAAGAVLVLAGCASMSTDECLVADWEAVGFEDGSRGAGSETLGRHRKACAKAGVAPDFLAYERGRQAGLEQYCQSSVGYRVGSSGGVYSGVCPAHLEPEFMAGYADGRELYELRSAVNDLESRLASRKHELEELRDELAAVEATVIAGDVETEERVRLLLEAKDMAKREGELETEIAELERQAAVARARLDDYRATRTASTY